MEDTLAHIGSIMNYAGFCKTVLRRDTPKQVTRQGWFRRGMGGIYVFVTTCGGRRQELMAELYDAQGHCISRARCGDALRAAEAAETMLHSCPTN